MIQTECEPKLISSFPETVEGGVRGVSDPGFPEKISAIPSVPIVQNNAFPTSRLKMIIPDSLSFRERALFPISRKFFQENV